MTLSPPARPLALVTGASSGMGAEFARRLEPLFSQAPPADNAAVLRAIDEDLGARGRLLESIERPLIRTVLNATRGNQVKAAERLGLKPTTLQSRMKKLGITRVEGYR